MARVVQSFFMMFLMIASSAIITLTSCALTTDFYDQSCPAAPFTIRQIVLQAILKEPRMGASLLRLHFHDCFVNGCDGSILLDDTKAFRGEKTAAPNLNSARGFEVIDQIKSALNQVCGGNVVSCADILTMAARDSVNLLGGPWWPVNLGRLDSKTASFHDANNDIPSPKYNLQQLVKNFQKHNLNLQDLVVLSGAHTIGLARCAVYKSRIVNDTNIDPIYRAMLQKGCPKNPKAHDSYTDPLDFTPAYFDTVYYQKLVQFRGLLHSDQELFKGDGGATSTDGLVRLYSLNPGAFWYAFGASMIKMGDLLPPPGHKGEIRLNCRKVNKK